MKLALVDVGRAAATSRARGHFLAIACLTICTLIYLWPLVRHIRTSLPASAGNTDVTESVWSVGWVRHALAHGSPLTFTDFLFVPFGADLRLHAAGLLQSLAAALFSPLLGIVGAYNLVLVITCLLNGLMAYGLVYWIVQDSPSALLAAACLMLSGVLVWHFAAGRLALPSLWIVTAVVWATTRALSSPTGWNTATVALAFLVAAFSDLQIFLFSILWAALLLAGRRLIGRVDGPGGRQVRALGMASLLAGVLVALHYGPILFNAPAHGYATPRLSDVAIYSVQLSDLADPRFIPYAYGLDFLAALLASIMFLRWSGQYRFWAIGGLAFVGLSLGPVLKPYEIPLPYSLLSLWPAAMQFRAPYRFLIPALLGWAVVMGLLLALLLPRIRGRAIVWGVVFALVAARLWYALAVFPLQIQTYPQYQFYVDLADEPGDFAVLEVPFGIRSGLDQIGDGGEALQYYQHIHGKRLLNGSVSRLPESVFSFYRSHPALMFFAGEAPQHEADLVGDFAEVLTWSGSRYVVLHRSLLSEGQAAEMAGFLEDQPQLELIRVERDLLVFRVR